jgi:hypothetical protein
METNGKLEDNNNKLPVIQQKQQQGVCNVFSMDTKHQYL